MLIFFGFGQICVGQIIIDDANPTEIRFTKDHVQSEPGRNLLTIPFSEFVQFHTNQELSEVREYSDPELSEAHYYYISEGVEYLAAGRIQDPQSEVANFVNFKLQNRSSYNFESALLAFDFVYKTSQLKQPYRLTLQYRVGSSNWRSVPGSTISTSSFGDSGDEWNTFSVQLNLDQIYLRDGDELGLRWVFINYSPEEIEDLLPIGLQRIEFYPEIAVHDDVKQGSLIITEIFPLTETDGQAFEYIELFNTSDLVLPLKGLQLRSSVGTVVIQQNVELPPYSSFVLSNLDLSGVETVQTSYRYDEHLLPTSGRVEISRSDQLIARAIYEATEPGQSLELDRMTHAINGYTSLQNLIPSESVLMSDIRGTPGSFGHTIPFYSRKLTTEGWYLLTLPGILPERFNRHDSIEFFDPSGEKLNIQQIEPYSTILIYKSGNLPVNLIVEDSPQIFSDHLMKVREMDDGFRIASSTKPHSFDLRSVTRDGDQPISPVVQIWDEQIQRFSLQYSDHYSSEKWHPFIMNDELSGELEHNEYRNITMAPVALEGTLPIKLYVGSGNNRQLSDEVLIGFTERTVQSQNDRFDLPKLSGLFQGDKQLPSMGKLYLTNPASKYRSNSFTHMPYNQRDQSRIGIGFKPSGSTGGIATIEWNLGNNIPDEWIMRLIDTETGITVDMREVNNYRFRYSGEPISIRDQNSFNGLKVFRPESRNRFVLVIEPFEVIAEAEKDEVKSGSIELRQNYPNPFNPATNITFYLPEERSVRIGVYNIVGQQVSMLIDETLQAGEHSVVWDAANNPSGIYIVQMEAGNRLLTRKITLIK